MESLFIVVAVATGAVTGWAQGIYWVQPQDWGCRYRGRDTTVRYLDQWDTVGPRSHRHCGTAHWLDRAGIAGLLLLGHWIGGVGWIAIGIGAVGAWEARECGYNLARWGTPISEVENVMGAGWETGSESAWWIRSGFWMHTARWGALLLGVAGWRLVG